MIKRLLCIAAGKTDIGERLTSKETTENPGTNEKSEEKAPTI